MKCLPHSCLKVHGDGLHANRWEYVDGCPEHFLVVMFLFARHDSKKKWNLLSVVTRWNKGMYAKQLGEGTSDNLESCVDTPTLGNGEKFNHPICGKEKMAAITNSIYNFIFLYLYGIFYAATYHSLHIVELLADQWLHSCRICINTDLAALLEPCWVVLFTRRADQKLMRSLWGDELFIFFEQRKCDHTSDDQRSNTSKKCELLSAEKVWLHFWTFKRSNTSKKCQLVWHLWHCE